MGIRRTSTRTLLTAAVAASLVAAGSAAFAAPADVTAGHAYRHGAVPMIGSAHAAAATSSVNMNYGGGAGSPKIGVTTGAPRVYLVFWGSQWGTKGTNSQGYTTLSKDSKGIAPRLQALFKGLGVNGETWSGVMTQYCEGIATGAQTCPSTAHHVGYPTGGAQAGVGVDTSSAEPSSANGHQIGAEAVKAAGHFGNHTAASNRNVQYVVVSPSGTFPDGFNTPNGGFCAWHDYTGDTTLNGGAVSSPYGQLAFTNMPYVTDAGAGCGQNFVNSGSAGTLDGVTIVEGHEYAETITDQNPAGGWTSSDGQENGDKCAWVNSGTGASANVKFATGSFAMQSTWANDANKGQGGCEMSHPIVK
jgi:serine protease